MKTRFWNPRQNKENMQKYLHNVPLDAPVVSKIKEKVNGKEKRNNQLSFRIKNLEDKMQKENMTDYNNLTKLTTPNQYLIFWFIP